MTSMNLQRSYFFILLCGLLCVFSLPAEVPAQYQGAGTYYIVAKHSGKFLDVRLETGNAAKANGTVIQQFQPHGGDNQKFSIQAAYNYLIISPVSSYSNSTLTYKCLDIPNAVATPVGVQQYDCNNGYNQQFIIEATIGGFYKIKVRSSGLYLDIAGADVGNKAILQQYPSNGGDNQLFQFIKVP